MIADGLERSTPRARRPGRFALGLSYMPALPLAIVIVVVLTAVFADLLTPYSPTETVLRAKLLPPFWEEGGSWAHPLGTDFLGRDLLSRMMHGARISMVVAVLTLALGGGLGTAIGLVAGYYGGRLDATLMRTADATMAFPVILFAIFLVVISGGGVNTVVIALALVLWARYARVIRAEALTLREKDFIAQARIIGCSPRQIIVRHLFPNVLNTLTVLLTLQVGWVIIVEASLSFLGAGIPPPTPAWGSMIAEGREYITSAWWVSFFPGLGILLTVLAFNMLGDWLRDTLDPQLRQV